MNSKSLVNEICKILDEKKGADITVLHVEKLTVLADYFIIASGHSSTQVKALADNVYEKLKEKETPALRTEGFTSGRWAVLDYGSVIVHIFNDESRMFYCLEKLWSDGENLIKYEGKEI